MRLKKTCFHDGIAFLNGTLVSWIYDVQNSIKEIMPRDHVAVHFASVKAYWTIKIKSNQIKSNLCSHQDQGKRPVFTIGLSLWCQLIKF